MKRKLYLIKCAIATCRFTRRVATIETAERLIEEHFQQSRNRKDRYGHELDIHAAYIANGKDLA